MPAPWKPQHMEAAQPDDPDIADTLLVISELDLATAREVCADEGIPADDLNGATLEQLQAVLRRELCGVATPLAASRDDSTAPSAAGSSWYDSDSSSTTAESDADEDDGEDELGAADRPRGAAVSRGGVDAARRPPPPSPRRPEPPSTPPATRIHPELLPSPTSLFPTGDAEERGERALLKRAAAGGFGMQINQNREVVAVSGQSRAVGVPVPSRIIAVNEHSVSSKADILAAIESTPIGSHVNFVFAIPADRDAFRLAVAVLKKATAIHDAVTHGDETKRAEALSHFIDGAALLTEATQDPKLSATVRAALQHKLEDVQTLIARYDAIPEAVPTHVSKSQPIPQQEPQQEPEPEPELEPEPEPEPELQMQPEPELKMQPQPQPQLQAQQQSQEAHHSLIDGQSECSLCGESGFSTTRDAGILCTNSLGSVHFFCAECMCFGVESECAGTTGRYEREITDRGTGLRSPAGSLPCPMWPTMCDCGSLPTGSIMSVIAAHDVARTAFMAAAQRLAVQEAEAARVVAEKKEVESKAADTPLDTLRRTIEAALAAGATVLCPKCGTTTEKNDACMHMTCHCGASFCYCCGRPSSRSGRPIDGEGIVGRSHCPRNPGGNELGCDATACYLEGNRGWDCWAIGTETKGEGARNEFHRRRMAYFLRCVAEQTDPELWSEFIAANPTMLDNTPTALRKIDWAEIAVAEMPLFGNTTLLDLPSSFMFGGDARPTGTGSNVDVHVLRTGERFLLCDEKGNPKHERHFWCSESAQVLMWGKKKKEKGGKVKSQTVTQIWTSPGVQSQAFSFPPGLTTALKAKLMMGQDSDFSRHALIIQVDGGKKDGSSIIVLVASDNIKRDVWAAALSHWMLEMSPKEYRAAMSARTPPGRATTGPPPPQPLAVRHAGRREPARAEDRGPITNPPADEARRRRGRRVGNGDDGEDEDEDLMGDQGWAQTNPADFSRAVNDMFENLFAEAEIQPAGLNPIQIRRIGADAAAVEAEEAVAARREEAAAAAESGARSERAAARRGLSSEQRLARARCISLRNRVDVMAQQGSLVDETWYDAAVALMDHGDWMRAEGTLRDVITMNAYAATDDDDDGDASSTAAAAAAVSLDHVATTVDELVGGGGGATAPVMEQPGENRAPAMASYSDFPTADELEDVARKEREAAEEAAEAVAAASALAKRQKRRALSKEDKKAKIACRQLQKVSAGLVESDDLGDAERYIEALVLLDEERWLEAERALRDATRCPRCGHGRSAGHKCGGGGGA